jgi:multidrug efflux pump subunit AcrB
MVPWAYGGKQRYVVADLEPDKMFGYGVSASDVSAAINQQNLIIPSGTAKMGTNEYFVKLNSSPALVTAINDLPVKTINGVTIYVRDVAHVSDKYMPQTNLVHVDGQKGALVSIYKHGGASTLDIVSRVRSVLPDAWTRLRNHDQLKITPMFDQSVFVRAAIGGVVTEALIAAGLTGMMILLFLGSWRSTLIICISIPLSILTSIIILWLLGHTLNVMTLGGMALAVGILVDDATVEIENIHRNLHQGKRLVRSILDGAQQIAVPAFVSTLCICIVFVPVTFITGPARYLFIPLGMAVVFAMMTSYILSRTLVPTLVHYLLESEVSLYGGKEEPGIAHEHAERARHVPILRSLVWSLAVCAGIFILSAMVVGISHFLSAHGKQVAWSHIPSWLKNLPQQFRTNPNRALGLWGGFVLVGIVFLMIGHQIAQNNVIWRTHEAFNRVFEKLRQFYGGFLALALEQKLATLTITVLFVGGSFFLFPHIGQDFFPQVDAGQLRMHVRVPPGTRLEETERYFARIEDYLRTQIPAGEINTVLDNIGIPNSGINLSLSDVSQIDPSDGEILVALTEHHHSTASYMKSLRKTLPKQFPSCMFYFAPSDIATQVLNFGIPAPIDVQILGPKPLAEKNLAIAEDLQKKIASIPGIADAHLQEVPSTPDIRVNVDRAMADQMGLTQASVANSLLVSLSSSGQISPNFWLDPINGFTYSVAVMTPQYKVNNTNALSNMPVANTGGSQPQLLGNLLESKPVRGRSPSVISDRDGLPIYDVEANVQGTDLGSVSNAINKLIDEEQSKLPVGSKIALRGQPESMHSSFTGLSEGIIGAILLVYMLMAINFQSWLDPLIILMALPAAIGGILLILFTTGTTISVPSLMGAMMCIGVATANSILMITFANDKRKEGLNAHDAALAAGMTRLRPVIMTALAMILGMLPMSLGLGDGGEQNAPLGRAVIGGLSAATFATLFFVPVVYSVLRKKNPERHIEPELREPNEMVPQVVATA